MTVTDSAQTDAQTDAAAPQADATETVPVETSEKKAGTGTMGRGDRGYLEALVKEVTDAYVEDKIVLEEGQVLTPHRIARVIDQNLKDRGIEHKATSAGSVDATLKRWVDYGFMVAAAKPFGFARYTEDALAPRGLTWCKERYAQEQKPNRDAERAKRKETKAAAKAQEQVPGQEALPVEAPVAPAEDHDGHTVVVDGHTVVVDGPVAVAEPEPPVIPGEPEPQPEPEPGEPCGTADDGAWS